MCNDPKSPQTAERCRWGLGFRVSVFRDLGFREPAEGITTASPIQADPVQGSRNQGTKGETLKGTRGLI